jgi:predicted transcriptional regulator of viral defense system
MVSDPSRTVIDVLSRPSLGGGASHVSEITRNYFASEHRNDAVLASYALRLGNRTVFKRLGYLLQALDIPDAAHLIDVCRDNISSGVSPLDPGIRTKGRIVTRWHLRVNAELGDRE